MPRKSLVDKLIDNQPTHQAKVDKGIACFHIHYSFPSGRNPQRFYNALDRLAERIWLNRLGPKVLEVQKINDVYLVMTLIKYYGGMYTVYEASLLEDSQILDQYGEILL